jgi:lipooligosaccharide transport system permease protein
MSSFSLATRPIEFYFAQYRRIWRGTAITSVVNPIVYLLALGWGLGQLVGDNELTFAGKSYSYLELVAPGLLAATAMQVASFESSWPVLSAIKWDRQYHAMLASPLRVGDIVFGHQAWIAFRLVTTAAVYAAVIAAFGAMNSPLGILAIPAAGLIGLAFASPIAAWGAYTESDASFVAIFRFLIVPMFLFSGTFFPVSELPTVLQGIAYLTPLWHGVDLCRQLTLGDVAVSSMLAHVGALLAWIAIGLTAARITYRRRLVL